MNKFMKLFAAVFAVSCQSAEQKAKPKLLIPVADVNLSTIKFDSSYRITYLLINTGNGVLKIDTVTASCGCTIPGISETTINPADTGLLVVDYKPVDTGNFNKKVVIKSNIDSSFSVVSFFGRAKK